MESPNDRRFGDDWTEEDEMEFLYMQSMNDNPYCNPNLEDPFSDTYVDPEDPFSDTYVDPEDPLG